jgi:tryptophan-rich sensory protein
VTTVLPPGPPAPFIWNRPGPLGGLLSALVPLLAVVAENALLAPVAQDPAFEAVPFAPPGWFVGLVWCVIYPLWGLARWRSHLAGEGGRKAAWWVVTLLVWGLAYPIVTGGFQVVPSAIGNALSLLLALVAAWRVGRYSTAAAALIAPSIAWIIFANFLGMVALTKLPTAGSP